MSEELAKVLKKKFKKFINQENVLSNLPTTSSNGKNVTWTEFHEYDSTSEQKKPLRSTPYPNPIKKMKISNSTPKVLSFDESDSDDFQDNSYTTFEDISNLCKPKSQGTKRKRNQNGWIVTSCDEIKPDKTNKSYDLENDSVSFESSDESDWDGKHFDERTISNEPAKCEQIIVRKKFARIEFYDSTSEDELSDSNVEQIFKPKIESLNNCQIIKPKGEKTVKLNISAQILKSNNNETSKISVPELKITEKPEYRKHFRKHVDTYIRHSHCLVFLKHPVKLFFNGKLSLTVLCGAVEILGHVLTYDNKKEFDVYSPRGLSYLCVETIENNMKTKEPLQNILESYGMRTKQIKDYLYRFGNHDCIIAVKTLNNNLTNYLSTHVAQYLFPKPVQCNKKIEKKLHCLFEIFEPKWRVYKKTEKWASYVETALNQLSNGFSCTLICGGKSVGKSTLFRFMINRLLNDVEKVICIDLDPGQSEFTIGGCISVTIIDQPIFGPNYTHLSTPVKSFFVGDVNVVDCVDRYISSIKDLLSFCQKNLSKNYPWVVNTMGFSKSIGTALTISIIKLVNPTSVLQINSSLKKVNYPADLTANFVQNYIFDFPIIIPQTKVDYNLEILKSLAQEIVEGEFQYEGRHIREMSIISYFSKMIEGGKEITSVAPYGVKMSSIKLHDLMYSKENIPAVFNGNLVALCKTNAATIDNRTLFDCVGFGIVRGIDLDSGELYLLTPIPENELDSVNSLIRGNINLPPSLYMTKGRQGLVPYISMRIQKGIHSIPKRSYRNLKTLAKKK